MQEKDLQAQARQLHEVERLSLRQIGQQLGISRKKVKRLLGLTETAAKDVGGIIAPYEGLIRQWYGEYPFLQAVQVHERLKGYGYEGSYNVVKRFTLPLRKRRKKETFHELETLPGQEAQVDWMQWEFPFGRAYGFVYILSYSRYLYARFYPKSTMEFLLDGHLEAFREIGGIAATHVYDNMKSVVISRRPAGTVTYNGQMLDFSRHYGFSLRACNPRRANEKGRVERVIRDMENWLRVNTFVSLMDLNRKFGAWRETRNCRIHRTTGKPPAEAVKEERLRALPGIVYKAYRHQPVKITKTAFIEFETNRYSVPSSYTGMVADMLVYPERIEVHIKGKPIAMHKRLFGEKQKVEHPAHRERLLCFTPQYKRQRIHQLMKNMDKDIAHFLSVTEQEGQDPQLVAYDLFKLLKGVARETLISAVKTAAAENIFRTSYIHGLLSPSGRQDNPVHPQDPGLLHITYERRPLDEYDELI